jgi:hypothetical protein
VEGSNRRLRQRRVPEDFEHPLAHLFGGLIGKRHGENRIRRHAALLDQIRNAVRNHARLAGARTGQQKHRPIDREDSFALLRVHVGEKVRHTSILRCCHICYLSRPLRKTFAQNR